MSDITLSFTINWARHWSLVALADVLGCEAVAALTCPVKIQVTPITSGASSKRRTVRLSGICRGYKFKTECILDAMVTESSLAYWCDDAPSHTVDWVIGGIKVNVGCDTTTFTEYEIPGYGRSGTFVEQHVPN